MKRYALYQLHGHTWLIVKISGLGIFCRVDKEGFKELLASTNRKYRWEYEPD
jgi:hypothetical protein